MSIKCLSVADVLTMQWYGWNEPQYGLKSVKFSGKRVLKDEHTYIFIFNDQQHREYEAFCDGIASMGWDVIFSAVAMNTVHPGRNRNFLVVIEKKEVSNEEGSGVRPVPQVQG